MSCTKARSIAPTGKSVSNDNAAVVSSNFPLSANRKAAVRSIRLSVELLDLWPWPRQNRMNSRAARLKLIGGLLDHLVDEIRLAAVRRLKSASARFPTPLKQRQEILARNFRPGPDQKRKFAVIFGTRHQFRVAKIRETRAGIRCRAYHHFLVAALDENVSDVLAQPAALRYRQEMILTLRLGASIRVSSSRLSERLSTGPATSIESSSASSRVISRRGFDKSAIRSPKAARAEWSISLTSRPMTSSNREVCSLPKLADPAANKSVMRRKSRRGMQYFFAKLRPQVRRSAIGVKPQRRTSAAPALATLLSFRWRNAMRHFRLRGRYRRCGSQFPTANTAPGTGSPATM